jgi:hypothetical protein
MEPPASKEGFKKQEQMKITWRTIVTAALLAAIIANRTYFLDNPRILRKSANMLVHLAM